MRPNEDEEGGASGSGFAAAAGNFAELDEEAQMAAAIKASLENVVAGDNKVNLNICERQSIILKTIKVGHISQWSPKSLLIHNAKTQLAPFFKK